MKINTSLLFALFGAVTYASPFSAEVARLPYAKGYFGESLPGLPIADIAAFERGSLLFVKRWDAAGGNPQNASSCVSCHSAPMPGGGGMSSQALVKVSSTNQIIQKNNRIEAKPHTSGETRRTPPLFGIGLLEFATQRKTDGIARPIFGALANVDSLRDFVVKAFSEELGIYSISECAKRNKRESSIYCIPQINENEIDDVTSYLRFTAAPPRSKLATDHAGRSTFIDIGCADCHTPTISLTSNAPPPLKGISAEAFTDLKVHNVGEGVKVRTTPLWGLKSYGPPYWHDASAKTIKDAVLKHNGEAVESKLKSLSLSDQEFSSLLGFLENL